MRWIFICLPLLMMSFPTTLCIGCAQRDSRPQVVAAAPPEAPPPTTPQPAPPPKPGTAPPAVTPQPGPEAAPPEATPSQRTIDLGYFNELIDRFAAADTLLLRLEAQPQGFQLVRKEYKLKRPDRFHTTHAFNGRGGERICDGKTLWMLSRARKEYVELPVVPGRPLRLGLLPDLFQRAREIAAGKDKYAGTLARGRRVETETIGHELCDVVEIKLDRPLGTRSRIWLTQAGRSPVRVQMNLANGAIAYKVRTLEIGAELDDATFTFTPGPDWTGGAVPPPPPPEAPGKDRSGSAPVQPERPGSASGTPPDDGHE